jgi:DNA-binding transcriptional LysR family regulator
LTLQQLRYFLATADQGSFSAAAAGLRLAQPSVSEQVRLLEAELGVALFVRAGRTLTLTEAGRMLRRHAGRILAAVDEARSAVAEVRRVLTGTVTLGVFGTASYHFVGEVIEGFRRRHPGVRVRLVGENSAQVVDDVRAGRLEAGLVVLPVDDEGLEVRPLRADEVLYASARLRRLREPATIEQVASVPLVMAFSTHGVRDPTRRQLTERAQRAGLAIEPAIEVEDLETAVDIAARGLADTVVSAAVARAPSWPRGLGTVPFAEPFFETLAIVTRRDAALSPAVAALLRIAERRLASPASPM